MPSKLDNKYYKGKYFRIHRDDDKILSKLFSDERPKKTFQEFVAACVQAYLRGDPNIMKVLKDFRDLSEIPPETLGQYAISQRQRNALLDEFEKKDKV